MDKLDTILVYFFCELFASIPKYSLTFCTFMFTSTNKLVINRSFLSFLAAWKTFNSGSDYFELSTSKSQSLFFKTTTNLTTNSGKSERTSVPNRIWTCNLLIMSQMHYRCAMGTLLYLRELPRLEFWAATYSSKLFWTSKKDPDKLDSFWNLNVFSYQSDTNVHT